MSVALGSILRVKEGLSESSAPLLIQARVAIRRVRPKHGLFTITSEEARSGDIEVCLVAMESKNRQKSHTTYPLLLNLL